MRYLGYGIGHKNQTKPSVLGNREGRPLTCPSASAMGNRRQTLRARLEANALNEESEEDKSDRESETEEEDEEDWNVRF